VGNRRNQDRHVQEVKPARERNLETCLMKRLNQDTIVAVFLLLFCAVFIGASFQIREMDFGQMASATWPRAILTLLTVLVMIYLAQSLSKPGNELADTEQITRTKGIVAWLKFYRNAIWCYVLFFAFLLSLDYLGMLIGGVLFVFGMLTVLGERTPKNFLIHALIAVVSVGLMWAIFTFGLRVILPQGMIFTTL